MVTGSKMFGSGDCGWRTCTPEPGMLKVMVFEAGGEVGQRVAQGGRIGGAVSGRADGEVREQG